MHYPQRNTRKFVFILILLVAIFFRVNDLATTPPGLYPDEAINGNDAMRVLDTGKPQVFFPDNNGREGLHIDLIALSFKIFGVHDWSLRLPTILFGILGVIAVYLLSKEMFSWEIGALSSFLMAISFWHVNFSRIAFSGILAPTLFTFCLYFLWKGLKGKHFCNYFLSGLFLGLGFYTYIPLRIAPLILALGLLAYWQFIKKDFAREQYEHSRDFIARGLVLLLLTTIIIALPIGAYFWTHAQDFSERTGQVFFWSPSDPAGSFKTLGSNIAKTFGMFNFTGDHNWRHNFSGRPMLLWPVGLLFFIGFVRSIFKFFKHKKNHNHFSAVQTFLLAWFFVGLAPAFLSNEGLPHALRSILVAPVVFIFAGEGCWWFFNWLKHWYGAYDKHLHEASLVTALVLVIFMISITMAEYRKYFIDWAQNPDTAAAFNQSYVELGEKINVLPEDIYKYVVVYADGVPVNVLDPFDPQGRTRGIPMPAQTIMFVTRTYSQEQQQNKKVFYLTPEQWIQKRAAISTSSRKAMIFELR